MRQDFLRAHAVCPSFVIFQAVVVFLWPISISQKGISVVKYITEQSIGMSWNVGLIEGRKRIAKIGGSR